MAGIAMPTEKVFCHFLASIFLALWLAVAHADFQAGMEAYNQGNYEAAFREWLPLAQQGEALAQFNLGNLYRKGKGVQLNYEQATQWYRLAADNGLASAQFVLGILYYFGEEGVPQDYVESHMWLNLAAVQGYKHSSGIRDHFGKKKTHEQIAEA